MATRGEKVFINSAVEQHLFTILMFPDYLSCPLLSSLIGKAITLSDSLPFTLSYHRNPAVVSQFIEKEELHCSSGFTFTIHAGFTYFGIIHNKNRFWF